MLTLWNVDPGSVTSGLESLLHPSCKQHVLTVAGSEGVIVKVLRHLLISMQTFGINLVLLQLTTLFPAS